MSKIAPELLIGFVEEVKSYLPQIKDGVKNYKKGSADVEPLQQAHRYAHTIKGAASMVGLSQLSHIAYYLEETLDPMQSQKLPATVKVKKFVTDTVKHIDKYLDKVVEDQETDLSQELDQVATHYRQIHGLPEPEDDAPAVEPAMEDFSAEFDLTDEAAMDAFFADADSDALDASANGSEEPPAMSMMDEFAAELQEAFNQEAEDHMQEIGRQLLKLENDLADKEALNAFKRSVHTLKGAAATVGFARIAELSHRMEDLLENADGKISQRDLALLYDSTDALTDEIAGQDTADAMSKLYARYAEHLSNINSEEVVEAVETVDLEQFAPRTEDAEALTPQQEETVKVETTATPQEIVRVPLERLDEVVGLASEYVITRTSLEQRVNELDAMVREFVPSLSRLERLTQQIDSDFNVRKLAHESGFGFDRFNAQPIIGRIAASPKNEMGDNGFADDNGRKDDPLRVIDPSMPDFDMLEFDRYGDMDILSRELIETASDIKTMHAELRNILADFDSILLRQGRISTDVQDRLMRIRMVPFATAVSRLRRAARVVANKQGKQVSLNVIGENIELDKKVLEGVADPLIHVLRNAVDHAIEPTSLRKIKGKPEKGRIDLHVYYEGNQVVIQVKDDGAGIDPEKLRKKAVEEGYVSAENAQALADEDLYELLFVPGFSTADEVNEFSGRGVGLDVLKSAVAEMKGNVKLDSKVNVGTTFTIRIPLTLAVIRALMIRANNEMFAIPLLAVSQIMRIERSAIENIGKKPVLRLENAVVPIYWLSNLLQLRTSSEEQSRTRLPVLILKIGLKQYAIIIDEIVEGRDIVIKSMGAHLSQVKAITGATLMGDGGVVLILDPIELLQSSIKANEPRWQPPKIERLRAKTMNVLVVDDSLSVRRVVTNMVKNAGWAPIQAKDGLEALEHIQASDELPDVILLDVEMPRMNGFELTATLRNQEKYKDIPIVMLTSRAGDKHRRRAFELGVNDYLIKPYQEEILLNAIRTVTGQ